MKYFNTFATWRQLTGIWNFVDHINVHSVVKFHLCSSYSSRDIPFEHSAPNRKSTVKCLQNLAMCSVCFWHSTTHLDTVTASFVIFWCANGSSHFTWWEDCCSSGLVRLRMCRLCSGQLMSADFIDLVKQTLLVDVEAWGWWFCR